MGIGWLNADGNGNKNEIKRGKPRPGYKANVAVASMNPGKVSDLLPMRQTYLIVTCHTPTGPRIKGKFDFYVCPWRDSFRLFEEYTNALELGEVAQLSFQVVEMTDAEVERYIRDQEERSC